MSPRSPYTTLQLPKQGIGEWCHPKLTADIDDSGLRACVRNGLLSTQLGLAFHVSSPRPYRLHLKSGLVSNDLEKDLGITGVYGRTIDGGAGILLDMPLNPEKELSHLSLETLSNDVVIGLMGVTLQRNPAR